MLKQRGELSRDGALSTDVKEPWHLTTFSCYNTCYNVPVEGTRARRLGVWPGKGARTCVHEPSEPARALCKAGRASCDVTFGPCVQEMCC